MNKNKNKNTILYSTLIILAFTLVPVSRVDFKIDIIKDHPLYDKRGYPIAPVASKTEPKTLPVNKNKVFTGEASWYDYDYPKGSGNWVTKNKLVAASRDFPRGTKLEVCSKDKCVDVVVTDYGPQKRTGRIIDMGSLAFSKICSLRRGVCQVSVEEIK